MTSRSRPSKMPCMFRAASIRSERTCRRSSGTFRNNKTFCTLEQQRIHGKRWTRLFTRTKDNRFQNRTEHHQPMSAPGHRPQNPAPQGRPSTVRVRRTINGRQQCTTTERDAPGICQMPNWRPNSKHHQPVGAPGLGSPRAPGLTIIPHHGEDNGLWEPIRNCGEVDTGRRRRGDRLGIH